MRNRSKLIPALIFLGFISLTLSPQLYGDITDLFGIPTNYFDLKLVNCKSIIKAGQPFSELLQFKLRSKHRGDAKNLKVRMGISEGKSTPSVCGFCFKINDLKNGESRTYRVPSNHKIPAFPQKVYYLTVHIEMDGMTVKKADHRFAILPALQKGKLIIEKVGIMGPLAHYVGDKLKFGVRFHNSGQVPRPAGWGFRIVIYPPKTIGYTGEHKGPGIPALSSKEYIFEWTPRIPGQHTMQVAALDGSSGIQEIFKFMVKEK